MDSVIGFGPLKLGQIPVSLGSNQLPKLSKVPAGSLTISSKMDNPIVEKILKEGINSVNLSMLDEGARKKILDDVAEKLYKQNKFIEAIEIVAKAGDTEKLTKIGDLFLSEGKPELATLCFIPTKDKQRLNNAAVLCIKAKNYKLAAKAYEAADNRQMADFIQKNFA